MGVAVGFMGYHGMAWGSMGITRNVMEKLGFLPFYGSAAKFNLNESKQLQVDVKVTRDRGMGRESTVPLTFRNSWENLFGLPEV
jgi:hypothetical protein